MINQLHARLHRELDQLADQLSAHVPGEPGTGRPPADLSATLELQRELQRRIRHLGQLAAELVRVSPDAVRPDRIGLGSDVRVHDLQSGGEVSYMLMSGDSIDLDSGEISIESPVGHALVGRRAGEEIVVATPQGTRRLRILSVTTLFEQMDDGAVTRVPVA